MYFYGTAALSAADLVMAEWQDILYHFAGDEMIDKERIKLLTAEKGKIEENRQL